MVEVWVHYTANNVGYVDIWICGYEESERHRQRSHRILRSNGYKILQLNCPNFVILTENFGKQQFSTPTDNISKFLNHAKICAASEIQLCSPGKTSFSPSITTIRGFKFCETLRTR